MKLNEIFNSTASVSWQKGPMGMEMGSVNVRGLDYILQLIQVTKNGMIHGPVNSLPVTPNTYFFSFAAVDYEWNSTDTETGDGKPIEVYGVMISELERIVNERGIDCVYIGCTNGKSNRRSLYQRMVRRYTSTGKWKLAGEADGEFFGDSKHIWAVQRV